MSIALGLQALLEGLGATSLAFAATKAKAVDAAGEQRPALITSDVALLEETGPEAVEVIIRELGPVPVIFRHGHAEGLPAMRTTRTRAQQAAAPPNVFVGVPRTGTAAMNLRILSLVNL